MSCLNRLFSLKELEALDEKQLAILDDAIKLEIRTSAEISKILRKKIEPIYKRWAPKTRAQRGRRARPKGKQK
jgi:hypothetical protein